MTELSAFVQHADRTEEKHVPVIDCPDTVAAGEFFEVDVTLGTEIAHPNTPEHHIDWIMLSFQPEGSRHTVHVATFNFLAHGAGPAGPDEPTFAHHRGAATMKTGRPGTLHALAYCNLHGLWESSRRLNVG